MLAGNPGCEYTETMELKKRVDLTREQYNLLTMHSALNVLNVLVYEIFMLEETYGTTQWSQQLAASLQDAAASLSDSSASATLVRNIDRFITASEQQLSSWREHITLQAEDLSDFDTSADNIAAIFDILRVRARELSARIDNPDSWETFDIITLHSNYMNVLRAIEKNSKGRYRIVNNLAEHDNGAYLVHFGITSHNNKSVFMPSVLQDVIRDLLANARKYTNPGGTIEAGLYDSGSEIRCVITDSGHGIPPAELDRVVEFGTRGSNVQAPTRGGGFGLTKAYWYTTHFGGRFWITSAPGAGTRIEIRIPCPGTQGGTA